MKSAITYYAPAEIIKHASEEMVILETQKAFTEQMATRLSMHLAKAAALDAGAWRFNQLPAASCFVVSPTGTGKSYILKVLSRASGMNIHFIDSTQLSSVGYKGLNLGQVLSQVLKDNPDFFDTPNVLVFDEFDKCFFDPNNEYVNATNIQRELLKLFEGGEYQIENVGTVNLDRTMVILAGACSDITAFLEKKRATGGKYGFGANIGPVERTITNEVLKRIDINTLVEHGMQRELAGRVNTVLHIGALTREDLLSFVKDPTSVSASSQYHHLLQERGCSLSITDSAAGKVADIALERRMGARTVPAVLSEQLCSAYAYLESHPEYNRATLTTDKDGKFDLRYRKGKRKPPERTPAEMPAYYGYFLVKEFASEFAINKFCSDMCALADLPGSQRQTLLYSFLEITCRYLKDTVPPSQWTVDALLRFAKITQCHGANPTSPFEIICNDYLHEWHKRMQRDHMTEKPEALVSFEVFYEQYQSAYKPHLAKILAEAIAYAGDEYCDTVERRA